MQPAGVDRAGRTSDGVERIVISRVRGEIVTHEPGRVEVRTDGGIVYEVQVPTTVSRKLPPVGSTFELLTTLIVRDDNHLLYGFTSESERILFARLRKVPKLGAVLALSVMSTYNVGRVVRAVTEEDRATLRAVKGIGQTTANRIVTELKGKLDDLASADASDGAVGASEREAVAALVGLGLSFTDAADGVREVTRDSRDEEARNPSEIVRQVLAARSSKRDR